MFSLLGWKHINVRMFYKQDRGAFHISFNSTRSSQRTLTKPFTNCDTEPRREVCRREGRKSPCTSSLETTFVLHAVKAAPLTLTQVEESDIIGLAWLRLSHNNNNWTRRQHEDSDYHIEWVLGYSQSQACLQFSHGNNLICDWIKASRSEHRASYPFFQIDLEF